MRAGGRLTERLQGSPRPRRRSPGRCVPGWPGMRSSLEFGLKVYAEVNWWLFAKSGIPGCRLGAAAGFIEIDFTHSGRTTVINY